MIVERKCLECGDEFTEGRADKKFCRDICRMAYNHQLREESTPAIYHKIKKQLNLNRKVLKQFNKGAKVTVRKDLLKSHGFDQRFFTHYWKNSKGDVYLFVFEFGFLSIKERNNNKYLLVTWQDYMNKSHY